VTVRSAGDPACGGGGSVNCGVFVINIQKVLPTCGNDDGEITFNVTGGTPPYEYGLNDGTGWTIVPGNPNFASLGEGAYTYRVYDSNGNVCERPVSLTNQTTVIASASLEQDTPCFGDA